MIDGYAAAGFKTVRIPVAWSNLMAGNNDGGTYTISTALLNRVQEVTDWVLANGMYAIINVHWDGGWWEKFPTDSTECMRKYLRIWEQVGHHFRNYNDYVLFASLNEEGVWKDIPIQRAYGLLNTINQAFVNIIRSQGGNNPQRHLQVQGYETNIDRTIDPMFQMPTDSRNRLAVSVHYYDPFAFTHISEPVNWGGIINPRTTWGTTADYNELNGYVSKMRTNFVDKGVPVIIGEYGVASWDAKFVREQESVRNYTIAVAKAFYDAGMLPVLWDVQLNPGNNEILCYYNRRTNPPAFVDPQMVAGFRDITGSTVSIRTATAAKHAAARPNVAVRGKTLNISSTTDSDFQVRMFDVRGKVRANFKVSGGTGSYSLSGMPAGRYFVEVSGAGFDVNSVSAVVVR
jgi:endoglucanase